MCIRDRADTPKQMEFDFPAYTEASFKSADFPPEIKIAYGKGRARKGPDGKTKRVAASLARKKNKEGVRTLTLDEDQIREDFKNKAWLYPQVEGVHPLGTNPDAPAKGNPLMFKDAGEYTDWILQHEKAHIDLSWADFKKANKGTAVTKGDYENEINKIATERWQASKKVIPEKTPEPGEVAPPFKGKVYKKELGAGRLVGSDGENIFLNEKAIKEDYESLSYLRGTYEPQMGMINSGTEMEHAIADHLNLDINKLKNNLERLSDPKEPWSGYAKFLELRHKRILASLDKLNIDPKRTTVSAKDPQILRLLTEATHDTLVHDFKFKSKYLGRTDRSGGKLLRHGTESTQPMVMDKLFHRKDSSGKTGFERMHSLINSGSWENLADLVDDIHKADVFKWQMEDGYDLPSAEILAGIHTVMDDLLKTHPKLSKPEAYAQALGWKKGGFNQGSHEEFIRKSLDNQLNGLADQLGISKKRLMTHLKSGESAFEGKIPAFSDEKMGITDLADLDNADIKSLHTRVAAIKIVERERLKQIAAKERSMVKKAAANELTTEDFVEYTMLMQKQMSEMNALKELKRGWGLMGQSFQLLKRMQESKAITQQEFEEVMETYLESTVQHEGRFTLIKGGYGKAIGAAGGKSNVDVAKERLLELARKGVLIDQTAGRPEASKALERAKIINQAAWMDVANDLWINAMLSGLRTHWINNSAQVMRAAGGLFAKVGGRIARGEEEGVTSFTGKPTQLSLKEARIYARKGAMRQAMYMFGMAYDVLRIMGRTQSDDAALAAPTKAAQMRLENAFGALDSSGAADTLQPRKPGERAVDTLEGMRGEKHQAQFQEAALNSASAADIGNSVENVVQKWIGNNAAEGFGRLRETEFGKGLATLWDGLYHGLLRQGTRKMVGFDQLFKQITARSHINAYLGIEAQVRYGLKNTEDIAEFVGKYGYGLIRPSGEIISKKALFKEAHDKYSNQYTGKQLKERIDSYIHEHSELRDENGVLLMTAEKRFEMADSILNEAQEWTFQTPHDKYAIEIGEVVPGQHKATYGNITKSVADLTQNSWLLKMYVPFITTMGNVMKDVVRFSPLGGGPTARFSMFNRWQHQHRADMASKDISRISAAKGRWLVGASWTAFAFGLACLLYTSDAADE